MTRCKIARVVWPALRRSLVLLGLVLTLVAKPETVGALPECAGDCDADGRVSAADVVRLTDIALGNGDVSACPTGDVDGDDRISEAEIMASVHDIFEDCGPATYEALAGELYDVAYSNRVVSLVQAAAIVAALEDAGSTNEEDLRALLSQVLQENGVQADRIGQIAIYARQDADDCDECLATCKGRCVQSPRGDCFCYEPLPPDPARVVILLLEDPEDESIALDAERIPCPPTLRHAGAADNFSTANGAEPASPSQALLTLIQQGSAQPAADFDGAGKDRLFGHTFTLPRNKCLRGAKVIFRARPLSISPSPGSRNDVVQLGFVDSAGQFVGAHWAAFFGSGNSGLPSLLGPQWTPSNFPLPHGATFVLNLASLPGGMNLLPDLNARRSLDVYVQDDTGVDYVSLVAYLCDCPTPTPTPTPACAPAPSGMVSWWRLNETSGTTVSDIAGGHHGTAQPGSIGSLAGSGPVTSTSWPPPSFPTGIVGTSLFFTGNRRVEVPHNTALEPGTGDFTVDAWVIFIATGNNQELNIVRKVDATPRGYKLVIDDFPSPPSLPTLSFETLGSITGYNVNWPINPNAWHHVAATLQRAGISQTVDLYLDGVLVIHYVGPNVGNIANSSDLLIGGDGVSAGQIALDEIEIFDRALTQTEIQAIFQAGSFGKCDLPTPTPSASPSRTPTPTASHTPTASATYTSSTTPTRTSTPTVSLTPTQSATATRTATPSATPTCIAPPAYANMVAWWPLDEPAGAVTVVDIGLPAANNGVPQPGPIGAPASGGPLSVPGNLVATPPDGALLFPVPTTYVEVPPSGDLDLANSDLTIDAWIRSVEVHPVLPGVINVVEPIVDKLGANDTGYAFYLQITGTCGTCPPSPQAPPPGTVQNVEMYLVFAVGDGTSTSFYQSNPIYTATFTVGGAPPLSKPWPDWMHVAVTVNRSAGNAGTFYLDGSHLDSQGNPVGSFAPVAGMNSATTPFWIGGTRLFPTTIEIHGEIEINELEIFNVALSEPEIQLIATSAAGKCKNISTPTATVSSTATRTPTHTFTSTPPVSFTATSLPSNTPTPTVTSSSTRTPSPTHTPVATAILTGTATLTATRTASFTVTQTLTSTRTRTPTITASFTHTPTRTASFTPTTCFGEVCVAKFNDQDQDGLHDPGEFNIAGWLIHVVDPGMNIIATLTTGVQQCTGVPGMMTYTVSEVPQSGWTQTFPPAGTHTVFVECGQLLNLEFGNFENPTPTRTRTSTPTRTPNIPPVE